MTIRCTVCRLGAGKRQAIDAALCSGHVSLAELETSSRISKSALQRHSKHINAPIVEAQTVQDAAIAQAALPIAPQVLQSAPIAQLAPFAARESAETTKGRLLERIELLWNESIEGLEASKEPLVITKPNGSTIEVPGDLRARAGFVREARKVLELQGEATGDLVSGQPNQIGNVIIVLPAPRPGSTPADYEEQVVDIATPNGRS